MNDLNPDGPHSPERTAEVADLVAEGIRYLNYATLGDAPGLGYPADAYSLLGHLYTATERMPQLFDQMAAFLSNWQASGQLADANGADPNQRTAMAMARLADATVRVQQADRALRDAQNAIAGLYVAEGKTRTEAERPEAPCPNQPPCEHPESAHDPGAGFPGEPPWCLDCDCGDIGTEGSDGNG